MDTAIWVVLFGVVYFVAEVTGMGLLPRIGLFTVAAVISVLFVKRKLQDKVAEKGELGKTGGANGFGKEEVS